MDLVIVGNLLDNAMEALKGQLYIYVSNFMADHINKAGEQYLSTKSGNHVAGVI